MSMRLMRSMMALAVLVSLAGVAAAGEAVQTNGLAKLVPADSLLFLAYDGNNKACEATALYALLSEPDIKAVLDGPLAAVKTFISQAAAKQGQADPDLILTLLKTRIGFAFVGLAPPAGEMMQPVPEVVLMIEVGKPDSKTAKAVALLLDHALAKAGLPPNIFKETKIGGLKAHTAQIGPLSVTHTTTQGLFLLGMGETLNKVLDKNTTKLSATKEFQRASRLTGGNEVLLLYYAHAMLMQKMGMIMPPEPARLLLDKEFGLSNVRSLSVGLAPKGKGFQTSVFIHTPGGPRGILKLIGGKPLDPAAVKLAPADAGFFFGLSFDPGAIWDFVVQYAGKQSPAAKRRIDEGLAEANKEIGFDIRKDLVGSLGGEFAVFGPTLSGAVKLTDAAKFKACIGSLMQRLAAEAARGNREMRGAKLTLSTMTYKGHTITYLDGRRFPLFFQPCYTLVGDYAVLSMYPMTLKAYLDDMAAGVNLLQNPDYVKVRAQLGKDASSVYYADTGLFLTNVYHLVPFAFGLAKMVPEEFQAMCPDPAKLPPPSVIAKHLFGCACGHRALPDGVVWESYSPIGLPTPPMMKQGSGAGSVATVAILAGMLLPALGKARQEARKVRAMSNLSQIGKATHMWLLMHGDNQNYPPSLKALLDKKVINEPKIFLHPQGGTQLQPGKFVTDFDSLMDRAGFTLKEHMVPMSMPMAWERRTFTPGGRNVVFFDAHVEFVNRGRFRQLMDQVDAFIKKHKPNPKPK